MTDISSKAKLQFRPRTIQGVVGNVEYDLVPTSVTWSVSGRKGDCTVSGQAVITVPAFVDQPIDPTRPAWGYLNVVGAGSGDFHSVMVSAFDPNARVTETCPGSLPRVRAVALDSAYLLHIISESNTHDGNRTVFKGTQTLDPDRFEDKLPAAARSALEGLTLPGVQDALKKARASAGRVVYTFKWERERRPGSGAGGKEWRD